MTARHQSSLFNIDGIQVQLGSKTSRQILNTVNKQIQCDCKASRCTLESTYN